MSRKSSVMNRLKAKWEIESNAQLIIIFIVFAVTGSTASKIAAPVVHFFGIYSETYPILYWPLRIILIFPLYQVLLIIFGWIFGQFKFFWTFEKKMLKRLKILKD
jgi:manganese efflux pump family protein